MLQRVLRENHTIDSLPASPAELWSGFTHVTSIYANLLEFTQEMFYMRKEFNSDKVGLLGHRLIVLKHQNGRRVFHRRPKLITLTRT